MNALNNKPLKLCFISNTDQSYLSEYIELTRYDVCENFVFSNLNFSVLKCFEPHIIVVDQYFMDKDYSSLIHSIQMNFKNVKIYFLSPEYAGQDRIIPSENCRNHFFSSFSLAIINHINFYIENKNDRNNYQEVG